MFDSVTTIGLLLTLVMIFSFQGNTILEKPLHIVLIAVPLILQTFLIFAIAPDVYLEVQHPCWSCNSNSSSANASAGVR